MLHITAPEIIYLITESLYLLAIFSHFFYLLSLGNHQSVLCIHEFGFQMPHISGITQYLSFSI